MSSRESAILALTASALMGVRRSYAKEGKFNKFYLVESTAWMQESFVSVLGEHASRLNIQERPSKDTSILEYITKTLFMVTKPGAVIAEGLSGKGSVNRGLKKIDRLLIPYFDKDHGDNLSVTRVYPKTKVVRGGTSTKDAIADQRRLSEGPLNGERESGLEYGTIACCKYRKADGTYAWRIIIPGTDGNHDSPMDWYTNFELMSADERQRGTAESLRFLDETMKQAGIQPDDPVEIVGHSQGGIIASLERTIFRGSLVLIGILFLCAVVFSMTGSGRMRQILTSMRLVREGEYSHKIQMRGSDEYATLAAEFNKLTDKLQQTEITERQFVSDASHELKTPLASIKLLSDSILQNEMDADTMREFVADIGAESDRLTRMAQKLLTLSRASADETEGGEHEVVDVGQTLSRVFRMLVPLADRQAVKLTASVEKGCTILSFEDDAYQILFNLVENGIKYNRENGSVHVRVRHEEDTVVIDVEDTGSGIPENALDSIFNRFYRVDKARSRQAGGAGLGLSIVHEMVGRNFGTISVRSTVGEGSCFTVTFPSFGSGEEDDPDA